MSILPPILGSDFPMMNNINDRPILQISKKSRKQQHHQEQQQQQNQKMQYTHLVNITDVPNTRGSSKRKRKSSHSQSIPIDLIYESENSDNTPVLENISLATTSKRLKTSSYLEKTTRNRKTRKSMNTPVPDMSLSSLRLTPSLSLSTSAFNKRSRSKSLYEINNRTLDDETLVSSTQEADLNEEQRSGKLLGDTVENFHKELSCIKN